MSVVSIPAPSSEAARKPDPAELVFQLCTGYMASACIQVAAKLKIADLLANGPKPVQQLASAAGANEDRLYRVLRVLASVGCPYRRGGQLRSHAGGPRDSWIG